MSKITLTSSFDFKNLSSDIVDEAIMIGLYNTTQDTIDEAQSNAPYQRGQLRKSIGNEPKNIVKGTKKVIVWPRGVVYAVRREYENFKNPHKKFYMKRAYDDVKGRARRNYEEAIEIVLKRKKLA